MHWRRNTKRVSVGIFILVLFLTDKEVIKGITFVSENYQENIDKGV